MACCCLLCNTNGSIYLLCIIYEVFWPSPEKTPASSIYPDGHPHGVRPWWGWALSAGGTQLACQYMKPVILDYLASKTICADELVVVSPDVGGVARARAFAEKLSDAPLAIVDKRRQGHNVAEVMNLIGDVRGKVAVMVDDMIDTAGTISKGAALLHQLGARGPAVLTLSLVLQ